MTLVTIFLLMAAYSAFHGRTMRAQLPNGAYVNRAHLFSDQIVLRAPNGGVVIRDIAYVLFNEEYVAGAFHDAPYSTVRFVYKVGDDRAFRDDAGAGDPFETMLDASGLEAEWPWGSEDPTRLDWQRLLVDQRYSRTWYE
jgi:hypothetical protein